MATQNSTLVSNYEAGTLNTTQGLSGRLRVAQGSVAVAADGTGADDIIMLAPIPSNASIVSIRLAADDLDSGSGTLAWDLGVYAEDGDVKDADAFASAIALGAAATAFTEYAFEARDIAETGQALWEDAAEASDPGGMLYVALTVQAAANAGQAGDIGFIIEYVVD